MAREDTIVKAGKGMESRSRGGVWRMRENNENVGGEGKGRMRRDGRENRV